MRSEWLRIYGILRRMRHRILRKPASEQFLSSPVSPGIYDMSEGLRSMYLPRHSAMAYVVDGRALVRRPILWKNCCSAKLSSVVGWRAHVLAGTTPLGNDKEACAPNLWRPYSSSVIRPNRPCSSSAIPAVK